MKEYIEREAALACVCEDCSGQNGCNVPCADYVRIKTLQAADVAEVRHGRWIDDKVSFYLGCSECGCFLEYAVDTFLDNGDHYNYCPNCGAKMDGGADDV